MFLRMFAVVAAIVLSATTSIAQDEPKSQTLFANCNVFDGKADKLAMGRSVLVEGKFIKEIGGETIKAAKHANVIDCDGRTLMPGLINAHVHLNMQFVGYGNDRGIQGAQLFTWKEICALAYEAEANISQGDAYVCSPFTAWIDLG